MTRTKRLYDEIPERYGDNEHISLQYHFDFKGKEITPGTKLKIKGEYGDTFVFQQLAHNSKLDSTWIDCMSTKLGVFRSFRVDRVSSVVVEKRSRAKKQ